ncbi:MAG: MaoC family dehydratase [Panacagrimonas sp.]
MTDTLLQLPSAPGLYIRALGTMRRKPGKNIRIPQLEVRVHAVQASPSKLEAYREICGFEYSPYLPITYPQVQAAALHLWLMLRPEFPIPLLGIVHLRNRFEMLRPMPAGEAYEVRAALVDGRRTHQGYEFDLLTEYSTTEGEVVYRALMTPLYRMKSDEARPKPSPAPTGLAEYRSFEVPADIGRRYAPIAGDFNPIHLSALTAKAFGFPRAIAHGMWALARATALLESAHGSAIRTLNMQFRQPLLLPGKVALKLEAQGAGLDFALLSRTSDKVHFTGAAH